jgi:hypothetical protein
MATRSMDFCKNLFCKNICKELLNCSINFMEKNKRCLEIFLTTMASGKNRNAGENKQIEEIEGASGNIVKDILERYSKTLLTKDKPYLVDAIWGTSVAGKIDEIQFEIFNAVFPKINQMLGNIFVRQQDSNQSAVVQYLVKAYIVMKLYYMIEQLKNVNGAQPVISIPKFVRFQEEIVSRN